jgi:hypothetical protein
VVEVFAASNAAGQTSLDQDVFLPDVVRPKRIIYDSVRNGTLAGEPFNFNMDVWKYFARAPDQLVVNGNRPPVPVSVPISGTSPTPATAGGVPSSPKVPSAAPLLARPREVNQSQRTLAGPALAASVLVLSAMTTL